MTANDVLLHTQALKKAYRMGGDTVWALAGVDIDIVRGEFVAVMGPSGSGKSTFMNLIGCLDTPTSGSILLDGSDISRLKADELAAIRNRYIGFVFQQFNLLPRMSALENVKLPLLYSGVPEQEWDTRAIACLEQVGLGKRMDHHPSQLSGGQQQRVAIARALVNDPSLLMADEPTGALDTRTSEEIMRLFEDLNNGGRTVILVTHESDIAAHAKRLLLFRDGKVISDAPTAVRRLAERERVPA
ncbi:MAG: ABC transporter ATP-binding protein [Gammaproteobacteria bacterium]|nr:ABC transporter ATP-binding protein [Gammaproteobacteria bacterium]